VGTRISGRVGVQWEREFLAAAPHASGSANLDTQRHRRRVAETWLPLGKPYPSELSHSSSPATIVIDTYSTINIIRYHAS
jgi:hypothetical protein